jgi:hypothetical protein
MQEGNRSNSATGSIGTHMFLNEAGRGGYKERFRRACDMPPSRPAAHNASAKAFWLSLVDRSQALEIREAQQPVRWRQSMLAPADSSLHRGAAQPVASRPFAEPSLSALVSGPSLLPTLAHQG